MIEPQEIQLLIPPSEKVVEDLLKEKPMWIGGDVVIYEVEQTSPTELVGKIKIDPSYFGLKNVTSEYELLQLANNLSNLQSFSVRSKLMQSGLGPLLGKPIIENGAIVIPTSIRSITGKPIEKVPSEFALGRFFSLGKGKLEDEELIKIASDVSNTNQPDVVKIPQIPKLFNDESLKKMEKDNDYLGEIDETSRSVAFRLPVKKYLTINAQSIVLEDILNITKEEGRKRLDQLLQIQEIQPGNLTTDDKLFYLGETDPVKVPIAVSLVINAGFDDLLGRHFPSVIIDPGFEGPIRTEFTSQPKGIYNKIEFAAFPVN